MFLRGGTLAGAAPFFIEEINMPGYLYDSYCHDTLTDVANQIVSILVHPDGWSPDGNFSLGVDYITLNPLTATERLFYPPECNIPGYLSWVGAQPADLVPMWSAGLVVIVIAWGIHMAKRSLGTEGRRG